MATWTTILNSQVSAGAPLTTSLVTALRDNPQAVLEGDSTLPQFPAGGLLLLDSQELSSAASTVQFDPVALSSFNYLQIAALTGGTAVSDIELQVRPSGGTWRAIAAVSNASGAGVTMFTVFNANNHMNGAEGSGNVVWCVASQRTLTVGSLGRTDANIVAVSSSDPGGGFHSFADEVDECRVTCTAGNFDAGSIFGLYGVKSGTIEGTAS